MLAPSAAWCPDGTVIRAAPGAALGVGRLITTAQQARPIGAAPRRTSYAPSSTAASTTSTRPARRARTSRRMRPTRIWSSPVTGAGGPDVVEHAARRVRASALGRTARRRWSRRATLSACGRSTTRSAAVAVPGGERSGTDAGDRSRRAGTRRSNRWSVTSSGSFTDVERTFFRDIRRLPAGHLLVATPAGVSDDGLPATSRLRSRAGRRARAYWTEFRRLFFAVRRRLESTTRCLHPPEWRRRLDAIVCVADRDLRGRSRRSLRGRRRGLARCTRGWSRTRNGTSGRSRRRSASRSNAGTAPLRRPTSWTDVLVWAPGGRFPWTGGSQGDFDDRALGSARVILNGSGGDQLGTPDGVSSGCDRAGRWRDAARFLFEAPGATRSLVASDGAASSRSRWRPRWVRQLHDALRSATAAEAILDGGRGVDAMAAESRQRACPARPAQPRSARALARADQRPPRCCRSSGCSSTRMRNGIELRFPFMDWDLVDVCALHSVAPLAAALAVRAPSPDGRSRTCCRPRSSSAEARRTPPTR